MPTSLVVKNGSNILPSTAGANSAAGVGHRQSAVVGDRQNVGAELGDLIGLHRIGLDGDDAAALLRHCVARVDGEVDDHLLELARVGAHRPEVAAVLDGQLDGLAEQAFEQVRDFGDHVRQLEDLRPECLLSRESEQLPR